jgi:C1A family cysteine protease
LKIADQRNQEELEHGGSAVHGITFLSDLSEDEFKAKFLTSDVSLKSKTPEFAPTSTKNVSAALVDWTGVYTTPVKDQGYCGSCWAFSATEQIESDSMRTLKTSYILSPEQITQCDKTSSGCNGGWTEHAYNYVNRAGGIETESDYPYTSYTGKTGTCTATSSKYVISVKGYKTISGESNMASYVQSTGPLSVCLDASSWNSYTGGIMSVCGKSVDHCVQAVGVYPTTGGYWKVRNSWGTSWGESGYIRLAYGQNTCDITNDPTYVEVSTA